MLDSVLALCDLKVVGLFGLVFCVVKAYMNSFPPKGMPPGPPIVPFTGNINLLRCNDRVHETIHQLGKKYGPIYRLQLGWYPAVVINEYNLMKEALVKAGDQCSNRMNYLFLQTLLSSSRLGVINSDGDHWKASRRLCISSLRDFGMGRATIEEKILEESDNMLFEIGKQRGEPFHFDLLFHKASANIICSMLFGKRFEYKDAEFAKLLQSLRLFLDNAMIFSSLTVMIPYLLPFFVFNKRIFGSLKLYRNFINLVKKELKQHRETYDPENLRDFVDVFLEGELQNKNHRLYSELNFSVLIIDLLVAGSDTTSASLNWAMLFMLHNPRVQDKCREEIMEVIGKSRKPSLRDRDQMPYVEATLCEVQRLGNIAPLSVTHATQGDVVLHGYTIPHKTAIIPDIYSIHLNPELWDEPKAFRPERFLDADGKLQKPPHFMPFSIGKRACLGENLAKSELFVFFVSLLQNFVYTCEDVDKLPTLRDAHCGITLTPGQYNIMANPV